MSSDRERSSYSRFLAQNPLIRIPTNLYSYTRSHSGSFLSSSSISPAGSKPSSSSSIYAGVTVFHIAGAAACSTYTDGGGTTYDGRPDGNLKYFKRKLNHNANNKQYIKLIKKGTFTQLTMRHSITSSPKKCSRWTLTAFTYWFNYRFVRQRISSCSKTNLSRRVNHAVECLFVFLD